MALIIWFFGTVGYAVRPQMVGYLLLVVELLIDFCLLRRNDSAARILPLLHDWKTIYSDNTSAIISRSSMNNSHL